MMNCHDFKGFTSCERFNFTDPEEDCIKIILELQVEIVYNKVSHCWIKDSKAKSIIMHLPTNVNAQVPQVYIVLIA